VLEDSKQQRLNINIREEEQTMGRKASKNNRRRKGKDKQKETFNTFGKYTAKSIRIRLAHQEKRKLKFNKKSKEKK